MAFLCPKTEMLQSKRSTAIHVATLIILSMYLAIFCCTFQLTINSAFQIKISVHAME